MRSEFTMSRVSAVERTNWLRGQKLTYSATVRFLDLVKPFTPLIPEVSVPETKVPFQQRIIWTSVTLVIFLVMSQMPLYGIVSSGKPWDGAKMGQNCRRA